jgi:S1-C subfamily serine protease
MAASGLALLMSTFLQGIGLVVKRRIRGRLGSTLDSLLGSVLSLALALGLVWLIAAVMVALPQMRAMRPHILESSIVRSINETLPPSNGLMKILARYDPFPAFKGPQISVDAPTKRLLRDPDIKAASASVVRVVGEACNYQVTGSGWAAGRGLVVTNAHVVAGESDTQVEERDGTDHDATVVWFDDNNDIAILRVPDLDVRALPMRDNAPTGTAAAVLGYPENGPFTVRAARFGSTSAVRSQDIYGNGPVTREVSSFRGSVRHGNSGGPVLDGDGAVITTVFAATVGDSVRGGYGVANPLVKSALAQVGTREVDTGGCV